MAWWRSVNGTTLMQGDLIPNCRIPVFLEDLSPLDEEEPQSVSVVEARLIVVSQSCDLAKGKNFVALCPISTLAEFEEINVEFRQKKRWENIRKGAESGLYLIASPEEPEDNRACLVVDFGQIVSVPIVYLQRHAEELGDRWRLESPYLEHFSQAFGRCYMRVGLPSQIAAFK
jgi:hypothetical protein